MTFPSSIAEDQHLHLPSAVLLWSEDGWIVMLDGANRHKKKVTNGENPRWSPDGSRFVFTRKHDVWLMDNALSKPVKVVSGAITEYGTGAYWTEQGEGIIFIPRKNSRQVVQLDLKTGKTKIIHDETRSPFKGYHLSQCAEVRINGRYLLTFTTDSGHRSMVVDLQAKKYITNTFMRAGDCGPAWSPDGRFILMTRRIRASRNRPLYITYFNRGDGSLSDSEYFIGTKWCYDAAISNDAKYVVYVSSGNVYICNVADVLAGKKKSYQLTSSGKSAGPSLYVFPEAIPEALR
jgi:Tol biopolymer transport system component